MKTRHFLSYVLLSNSTTNLFAMDYKEEIELKSTTDNYQSESSIVATVEGDDRGIDITL